jgi:hypothetical protein
MLLPGQDTRPYSPSNSSNEIFSESLVVDWAGSGRTSRPYQTPSDTARDLVALTVLAEFSLA